MLSGQSLKNESIWRKSVATDSSLNYRDQIQIKRALISVSDKTGLVELAKDLVSSGVEIVSTGSTAKQIAEAGLPVTEVSKLTGFEETLDGRVKTLHPNVHAGLLADLRRPEHKQQLQDLGLKPFELVIVNLYPFVETVNSGADFDESVEQIDIGGPAMVRASAKNFANVAVVTSTDDYDKVREAVGSGGSSLRMRRELALKAFTTTANYDAAVSGWLAESDAEQIGKSDLPVELELSANRQSVLRYGENSHQVAALYSRTDLSPGLAQARLLHGKEMSFNNYVDADSALRVAFDFREPAVAIIKHANPCGVGQADDVSDAYQKAFECDPVSAFGGVVAVNRKLTLAMAEKMSEIFTEVVVAPAYETEALAVLTAKKNLRILQLAGDFRYPETELKQISGGLLMQQVDRFDAVNAGDWKLVSGKRPESDVLRDLEFAWRAVRGVKSNAILLAKDSASVGIGMGQVNRVDSCKLAVDRAAEKVSGSVAASDAFFPFADGLQILIDAGVTAVVQPGGSVRDEEVIELAKANSIAMFFTDQRHFFH
jgi:phosphoribosylaminoimidazolecarboxamide formyltransferase/IMP cyclohydrolase